MKKYLTIFILSLKNEKKFQFDFLFSLIAVPLQLMVTILFWQKVLPTTDTQLTQKALITYFLFLEILQIGFSPAQMVTFELWNEVNNGTVITWLNRPINYPVSIYMQKLAIFLFQGLLPLSTIGSLFVLSDKMTIGSLFLGLLTALLGFSLLFCIQFVIGCLSFWTRNVIVLRDVIMSILFILGGLILPLELTPSIIQTIAFYTPVSYVYYFPAKILTNSFSEIQLLSTLGIQILWLLIFLITIHILWRMGTQDRITFGA
ncbi:ABC-2 family transporter protein [Enterococcus sp. S86.2]|uniref:ABC transporter permease n=1 Tax=Enterococcus sp. S86.2 TaxID=3031299 RepID=UPI0026F2E332|nr:ABC-2 family transporter protein [Enterococcus sp. S86.2]